MHSENELNEAMVRVFCLQLDAGITDILYELQAGKQKSAKSSGDAAGLCFCSFWCQSGNKMNKGSPAYTCICFISINEESEPFSLILKGHSTNFTHAVYLSSTIQPVK